MTDENLDSPFPLSVVKTLATTIPILSGMTALTYDVGFFYGVQISYFTFFTLTEHLAFAIQAIPSAFLFAFWVVSAIITNRYMENKEATQISEIEASLPKMPHEQIVALANKLTRREKLKAVLRPIFIIAWVGLLAALLYNRSFVLALWFGVVPIFQYYWDVATATTVNRIITTVLAITFTLCIAFCFGIERAESNISSSIVSRVSTDANVINARVLRSGERGMLVYAVDDKQLQFLKWDSIKQVDSQK